MPLRPGCSVKTEESHEVPQWLAAGFFDGGSRHTL
jgi:hypothetical protein